MTDIEDRIGRVGGEGWDREGGRIVQMGAWWGEEKRFNVPVYSQDLDDLGISGVLRDGIRGLKELWK